MGGEVVQAKGQTCCLALAFELRKEVTQVLRLE